MTTEDDSSASTFLGRWKSGRAWKTPAEARASKKVVTVGVLGHSWDQKMAQRQQAKMEKALLTEIRQERESRERARAEQRALTKKRREEYAKTRMLNTHQVVTNSKKLKRMSKKQFKKLIQK